MASTRPPGEEASASHRAGPRCSGQRRDLVPWCWGAPPRHFLAVLLAAGHSASLTAPHPAFANNWGHGRALGGEGGALTWASVSLLERDTENGRAAWGKAPGPLTTWSHCTSPHRPAPAPVPREDNKPAPCGSSSCQGSPQLAFSHTLTRALGHTRPLTATCPRTAPARAQQIRAQLRGRAACVQMLSARPLVHAPSGPHAL